MLHSVQHLDGSQCTSSEMLSGSKHDNEIQRNVIDRVVTLYVSRFTFYACLLSPPPPNPNAGKQHQQWQTY